MPELPNLEGQPGWVVIVVVALFVGGALGTLWLRGRSKDRSADEPVPIPASVTGGGVDVALAGRSGDQVLAQMTREAMTHLADTARREAEESEQVRRELAAERTKSDALAREFHDLAVTMAAMQVNLDHITAQWHACQERVRFLNGRVEERGHENEPG